MAAICPSCGYAFIPGSDRCEQCLHSLMTKDLPRARRGETLQQVIMTAPISDLVTGSDLLVCNPGDSVKKIVEIFQRKKKNCILVIDYTKLVGIVSFRDLLSKTAGSSKAFDTLTAEDVMTKNPEAVHPDNPIAFAVNKMSMGGFRHVPVMAEDGSPITIISIKDVLEYLDRRD